MIISILIFIYFQQNFTYFTYLLLTQFDMIQIFMNILISTLLISIFCFSIYSESNALLPDVDFDISMDTSHLLNDKTYQQIKEVYNHNRLSKMQYATEPKTPKVMHRIWIGTKPFPKIFAQYKESCEKLHPEWEHKLWTDKDVENWNFRNKDLYNKASSYQEKSDILRYEILHKHGGLYTDTDVMCLQTFDELHHKYNFFTLYTGTIHNSIIASAPNNSIFLRTLANIRNHWDSVENIFTKEGFRDQKRLMRLAIYRTWMPFQAVVHENLASLKNSDAILMPRSYLFPEYVKLGPIDTFLQFINYEYDGRLTKQMAIKIKPETITLQDFGRKKEVINLSKLKMMKWYEKLYTKIKDKLR